MNYELRGGCAAKIGQKQYHKKHKALCAAQKAQKGIWRGGAAAPRRLDRSSTTKSTKRFARHKKQKKEFGEVVRLRRG